MGLDPALEGCEEPFEEAGRLFKGHPRVLCAEKGDDWGQHKFKFFGRPPAAKPDWAEALKALRGFIEPFRQVLNPLLVGLVWNRWSRCAAGLTNKPRFDKLPTKSRKECCVPTTLNVNEAKTHFSSVVSEVEKNLVAFTIMRYGRPVARIVPLESPRRTFKPIPGLAGKVKVKCNLFDDSSSEWESCGDAPTAS